MAHEPRSTANALMHSNRPMGANTDASSDKESEGTETMPRECESANVMTGKNYELVRAPVTMGSGASEHVMPLHRCPQAELEKGSSYGRTCAAANGTTIKNEGEKSVLMAADMANGGV